MELLNTEQYRGIIDVNKDWFLIKIEEPNVKDAKILRKQFRSLFNSSMSTFGYSNSRFCRRYISGGFYISFINNNNGIILIFCQVKKHLDISFLRQFSMRLSKITQNKPTITTNQLKNDEGEVIEEKMNKIINGEMEIAFSVGEIINPKIIKFGNCYGIENKKS